MKRLTTLIVVMGILLAAGLSCAGPDSRDDRDPTATPAVTATSPESPAENATESEPSATLEAGTPTETIAATATATHTSEPSPTPTLEAPSATASPTATATAFPLGLEASLPQTDQLSDPGFFLANQGSLSALDLANSYNDSSAHLERLDEWGFKEHLFREFGRDSAGDADPVPLYLLTTVNEYGSPEQALDAMDWLRALNSSQGHEFVDPAPEIGDLTIASGVETADGTPSAIVFVQMGPRIYAYFAQSGDPLAFVLALAEQNTRRINEAT